MGLKAQSITQVVSLSIDGNKIRNYDETGQKDAAYQTLLDYLEEVKTSTSPTYIYIMVDAGDEFKYIAEAQSDDDPVQLGDTDTKDQYGSEPEEALATGQSVYSEMQYSSEYGYMLSAFTPITDDTGSVVGVVGLDLGADIVSETMQQYLPFIFILMIFSCLFSFFSISMVVSKLIVRPIKALESASAHMAGGNLDVRIPAEYLKKEDEIGRLYNAFQTVANFMALIIKDISYVLAEMSSKNLNIEIRRDYIGDFKPIRVSIVNILNTYNALLRDMELVSNQVSLSSQQVSDISGDLASGSIRQSSVIEELSATMTQISGDAARSSASVSRTKDYISEMHINIQSSNDQMLQMLEAMHEIDATSGEISKIIKMIDDITFQTNMLALNAAVEAARAGAEGKGFAVVAEEVRQLATKTARAASQTAELISSSMNAVKKGTALAEQAAGTLGEASDKVTYVYEDIQEIAKVTNNQASAMKEIMTGFRHISEVVHNNSAKSQEGAASSEELSYQAELLHEKLSEFRLKNQSIRQ